MCIIMSLYISDIFVYPFTKCLSGDRVNTHKEGMEDTRVDGWSVQLFGLINGTAGMIDEWDFPDLKAADLHACNLAQHHQISDISRGRSAFDIP